MCTGRYGWIWEDLGKEANMIKMYHIKFSNN